MLCTVQGGVSHIAPRKSKELIGRFAPQFSGYAQHDAQASATSAWLQQCIMQHYSVDACVRVCACVCACWEFLLVYRCQGCNDGLANYYYYYYYYHYHYYYYFYYYLLSSVGCLVGDNLTSSLCTGNCNAGGRLPIIQTAVWPLM